MSDILENTFGFSLINTGSSPGARLCSVVQHEGMKFLPPREFGEGNFTEMRDGGMEMKGRGRGWREEGRSKQNNGGGGSGGEERWMDGIFV